MAQTKRTKPSPESPSVASELQAGSPEPQAASSELREEIRRRAYQYYEERGREEGRAEEDWLRAEAEVVSRNKANAA
ncbi:MAG: DUF2934 domain-containing protein [Gammaproteobacteria bacterium]